MNDFAEPLAVLQWLVSGGYFLIGVMSVTSWLRSRDRPQLYLAMSLASLGVLSLLGQVWMRYTTGVQPPVLSLVLLLGSGFCFFLFRSAVIPARRPPIAGVSSTAARNCTGRPGVGRPRSAGTRCGCCSAACSTVIRWRR